MTSVYNQTIKMFGSHPEPSFESPEQQVSVWGREWGCDDIEIDYDKVQLNGGGTTAPLARWFVIPCTDVARARAGRGIDAQSAVIALQTES